MSALSAATISAAAGGYPDLAKQLPLWLILAGGHLTAAVLLFKNISH